MCERGREREREERKWGGSDRHYNWEGQETISMVLKVPRQCPLVLLVEAMHMIRIVFLYGVERAT
jgi:hypothetical protein